MSHDPQSPNEAGKRPWDTNNPMLVQIFAAAISGFAANPNFFGPLYQQSPKAAVEFADQVVLAAAPEPLSLSAQTRLVGGGS